MAAKTESVDTLREDIFEKDEVFDRKALKEAKKQAKKQAQLDKRTNNGKAGNNQGRKRKGGTGRIVAIIVAILVVGGLAAAIVLDVLSIRTRYLNNILANIPIVNNLVKKETETGENGEETSIYNDKTRDELVAEILSRENAIKSLEQDVTRLKNTNTSLVKNTQNVGSIDSRVRSFEMERAAFEREVALKDPAIFAKYYESMNQENAEILYKEALGQNEKAKEAKKVINTFKNIDGKDGAKILEELMRTDMDIVVFIMNGLGDDSSGEILANMKPENAASVTKMMAPNNNPVANAE